MTPEQIERASQMWRRGMTSEEIGRELGFSASTIRYHAYQHRKAFPVRPPGSTSGMTPELVERAAELRRQGMPWRDVANEVGFCEVHVAKCVCAAHPELVDRTRTREGSRERRRRMSELWAQGKTIREIAEEMGMSVKAVSNTMSRHREEFPYRHMRKSHKKSKRISEKLSDWEVVELYCAWRNGASIKQLRRRYHMGHETVKEVIARFEALARERGYDVGRA